METMIELGAIGIGVALFVLLAAVSLALDAGRRGGARGNGFVPGNYHPGGHDHADSSAYHGH